MIKARNSHGQETGRTGRGRGAAASAGCSADVRRLGYDVRVAVGPCIGRCTCDHARFRVAAPRGWGGRSVRVGKWPGPMLTLCRGHVEVERGAQVAGCRASHALLAVPGVGPSPAQHQARLQHPYRQHQCLCQWQRCSCWPCRPYRRCRFCSSASLQLLAVRPLLLTTRGLPQRTPPNSCSLCSCKPPILLPGWSPSWRGC